MHFIACLLCRVCLVLEWLYAGTLNNTNAAEVRSMAQSTLSSRGGKAQQTAQQVLQHLVECLQQQAKLVKQLQEVGACCDTCGYMGV
jgi:hypothetical protein